MNEKWTVCQVYWAFCFSPWAALRPGLYNSHHGRRISRGPISTAAQTGPGNEACQSQFLFTHSHSLYLFLSLLPLMPNNLPPLFPPSIFGPKPFFVSSLRIRFCFFVRRLVAGAIDLHKFVCVCVCVAHGFLHRGALLYQEIGVGCLTALADKVSLSLKWQALLHSTSPHHNPHLSGRLSASRFNAVWLMPSFLQWVWEKVLFMLKCSGIKSLM